MVISVNIPDGVFRYVHVLSAANFVIVLRSFVTVVFCNTSSVPTNDAAPGTVTRLSTLPFDDLIFVLYLKYIFNWLLVTYAIEPKPL